MSYSSWQRVTRLLVLALLYTLMLSACGSATPHVTEVVPTSRLIQPYQPLERIFV